MKQDCEHGGKLEHKSTATTNVTWQKQKEGNDMPLSQ